jgi:hypothetical protein
MSHSVYNIDTIRNLAGNTIWFLIEKKKTDGFNSLRKIERKRYRQLLKLAKFNIINIEYMIYSGSWKGFKSVVILWIRWAQTHDFCINRLPAISTSLPPLLRFLHAFHHHYNSYTPHTATANPTLLLLLRILLILAVEFLHVFYHHCESYWY